LFRSGAGNADPGILFLEFRNLCRNRREFLILTGMRSWR